MEEGIATGPADLPPPARARSSGAASRPPAAAIVLALLIAYASLFSAVLAWRASLSAIESDRLTSLSVQQQARRAQIEAGLEGIVAQDRRFVADYGQYALTARELQRQADELRPTDPDAADELDLEAHANLALARSVQPLFRGASGVYLDENGDVPYDTAYVLRNLREGNTELHELNPGQVAAQGHAADEHTLRLIGVAALMVAALFILTIAQVTADRPRRRQLYVAAFVAGAGLAGVGSFIFGLLELAGAG
jgi:hypothetical protein